MYKVVLDVIVPLQLVSKFIIIIILCTKLVFTFLFVVELNNCYSYQRIIFHELYVVILRQKIATMTQNEYVCGICCRTEVAGDVISGENVKSRAILC